MALALLEASDRAVHHLFRERGIRVAAHLGSGDELLAVLGQTRSLSVIAVAAHPTFLSAAVVAAADSAGVRLIAVADSDAERQWARVLGVSAVLTSSDEWSLWDAALTGSSAASGPAGARTVTNVVAVWGPAGAPGRTTVAINIAAELARSGAFAVLVDADTYGGSVAPALGLSDEAPGFAAACRLASTNSLTEGQLDRVAAHYGEGPAQFRVLSGVSNPARWAELGGERTAAVIRACAHWADFTIVDVGFSLEQATERFDEGVVPHRNSTTLAALRHADLIVAVGSADPVGLARFLRGHADIRSMLPEIPIIEAINRVRAGSIGPSPSRQLRHTLSRFGGIRSPHLIPYDRALADAALLSGHTWAHAASRSAARAAVRVLAERIRNAAPEHPRETPDSDVRPRNRVA